VVGKARGCGAAGLLRVPAVSAQGCLGLGCGLVGLFFASTQGAGAASWSIQPVSSPVLPAGQLSAVSCVSTTVCTAVGTVAERWETHRWSIQPAAGAGVSCVSRPEAVVWLWNVSEDC